MQVTVTIPDELAAHAQARGVALDVYVREIVEEKMARNETEDCKRRTAVDAMMQFAGKHGILRNDSNLADALHEGHKY